MRNDRLSIGPNSLKSGNYEQTLQTLGSPDEQTQIRRIQMTCATDTQVPCKAAGVAGLGCLFLAPLQTLQLWYERSRQRRRLAHLDDRLLRDIGIDRIAAMEEISKPFWRG
jgi:uncharacterized protein YjiS (DUF1127 family)